MRKWPTGWVQTHLYMGYYGFTNLWADRLGRDISGRIWVVHGSDWKLSPLVIYLPTLFFFAIPNQQDESIGLPTHAQWRRLRSTDTDTTNGHNTTQMPANIFVITKLGHKHVKSRRTWKYEFIFGITKIGFLSMVAVWGVVNDSGCVLCSQGEGSHDHLVFEWVIRVWQLLFYRGIKFIDDLCTGVWIRMDDLAG